MKPDQTSPNQEPQIVSNPNLTPSPTPVQAESKPTAASTPQPQDDQVTATPVVDPAATTGAADATGTQASSTAPPVDPAIDALTASDADIIEKEWVDKADTIMAARANDPAGEEEAEEDLSQAYLKKRFNIDVEDAK